MKTINVLTKHFTSKEKKCFRGRDAEVADQKLRTD